MVRRFERIRKGHPVIERRWLVLVALMLGLSACANLGAELPHCPERGVNLPGSLVLEAQAVPSAHYGPCVSQLEPGWEANDLRAETGRAWLWLDSDRMGDRFLTVTLQPSCDVRAATPAESGLEGIDLYVDIATPDAIATLVVVPVAERHLEYTIELVARLREAGLATRGWEAFGRAFSERVSGVLESGYVALIVDDADAEAGTVAVRIPEAPRDEEPGVTFDQINQRFGTAEGAEVYRGHWYYLFEGGCVAYEFDAEGPGSADLENVVEGALDFAPLEQLREIARRDGFDI
jgi:hypothetical protein